MKTELFDINGKTVEIPVAENYKDCMVLIKSDRFRLTGKIDSTVNILMQLFKPFGNTFLFWFRMASYKGFWYPLCRFMYERISQKYKIQIPVFTKIGYGFYLGHGICIVINGGTVIGNNVNISQFVNIGTNHDTPALIGDNVYIAPHVCIVEDVVIGNDSSIGAGAVVTKNIPDNATAVGVSAKVINYNNPGRYVTKRYPIASAK